MGITSAAPISDGDVFGMLTVINYAGVTARGAKQYTCVCECGIGRVVRADNLRAGRTVSCGSAGCKSKTQAKEAAKRAGPRFLVLAAEGERGWTPKCYCNLTLFVIYQMNEDGTRVEPPVFRSTRIHNLQENKSKTSPEARGLTALRQLGLIGEQLDRTQTKYAQSEGVKTQVTHVGGLIGLRDWYVEQRGDIALYESDAY